MGAIEDKLKAMGHTLPEPFKFPKPNRTGCVVVGSIVFVSGHGRYNGPTPGIKTVGKVGRDLTIEEGYATARLAALSILSSLKQELGDLDRDAVRQFRHPDRRARMLAVLGTQQLVEEIRRAVDHLRHPVESR